MNPNQQPHSIEPDGSSDTASSDQTAHTRSLWIAGVRYPSGTEIWCAYRSGEAAWTTDRQLAARYESASSAAMAARELTEGEAIPFWTMDDG